MVILIEQSKFQSIEEPTKAYIYRHNFKTGIFYIIFVTKIFSLFWWHSGGS
jgi:hypothetical protein